MGGRGSSSVRGGGGGNGSADGVLLNNKPVTVTTTFYSAGSKSGGTYGSYKDEVLEATTDGNGNLSFGYADWKHSAPSAKTNKTHKAETTITHGAVNGEMVGVDLSKAKSVSGKTFNIKSEIKSQGFKWDGKNKMWVKK